MHYIKGTLSLGIKYQQSTNGNILHGRYDVDWTGDKDTRRSTSGYYFILVGGVISWSSKKQAICTIILNKFRIYGFGKGHSRSSLASKIIK